MEVGRTGELRSETITVNMGPQHPSTHGVLNIVIELDGETIVSAQPTIGFLHTGIEKTAEQKKWQQVVPLVERMDYLGPQSNSLAFCLSVEKLLGLEMPDRVTWIRVLIAELQRISSHLVWLGTHGMEVGSITVMLYAFREREQMLNFNEMLAGFRMFPSYLRIGGLREDLPRGFKETIKDFLDQFGKKLDDYEKLLTSNPIWLKRTRGVGKLSKEDTLAWALVGPMARAVGIPYDVRKTFPYLKYETFDFDVFWVQPVIPNPSRLDSGDNNQNFAGAWATYKPRKGTFVDLYYLMLDNTNTVTQQGIARGNSTLHTAGTRFAGDKDGFLWDVEAAPGLGDTHEAVARGSRGTVTVRHDPAAGPQPELFVQAADPAGRIAVAAAGSGEATGEPDSTATAAASARAVPLTSVLIPGSPHSTAAPCALPSA